VNTAQQSMEHTNLFTPNRWTSIYLKLVENCKQREIDGYVEKHHIIPKALGGDKKDLSNLVRFTAREHLFAHRLLVRMTRGRDKHKMISALWAMCNLRSPVHQGQRAIPNSRVYEEARKAYAQKTSEAKRGVPKSEDHKRKIGLAHKGKTISEEHRVAISKFRTGKSTRPMTDEEKKHLSSVKISKAAEHHLAVPCSYLGVEYETINAASRATGVSQYLIKKDKSFTR
jgi:hypothetical protein